MGSRMALLSAALCAVISIPSRRAGACGGGAVTTTAGSIGVNAQRIVLSVHDGVTDVITQIGIPITTADYAVLIPASGQPTLDPNPIASADLDALDRLTAPEIRREAPSSDDGIGCGCPFASGGAANTSAIEGVQVSQPVTIGPVKAVTLTADTGEAVNAWLAQNGFVLPADAQSIVDGYAGAGRYFIAVRRAASAATGGPTSVGVHFTLAGDQRALPLRFARLGAAEQVGFTVFVAAADPVQPAAPFAKLSLLDLDAATLKTSGYAAALSAAIALQGNHAFVVEGLSYPSQLSQALGSSPIGGILANTRWLTRLSTILPASSLDSDVAFTEKVSGPAPRSRAVMRLSPRGPGIDPRGAIGMAMLGLAAVLRRRPRR